MSIRENLEIYHLFNPEELVRVLVEQYGAREHPSQAGGFLIGIPEVPFYKPRQAEDHISILGFNYAPLPSLLLQALINHPELVPDETRVRWTAEQDLVLEGYIGVLRRLSYNTHVSGE